VCRRGGKRKAERKKKGGSAREHCRRKRPAAVVRGEEKDVCPAELKKEKKKYGIAKGGIPTERRVSPKERGKGGRWCFYTY